MSTGRTDARSFLESIVGYTSPTDAGQQEEWRPIRLATIDPAYLSGLPRVTFDGETALTGRGYTWLGPYQPAPGDRVALVPVGRSYVIAGNVETALAPTGTPIPVAEDDPANKAYVDGAYTRRTRETALSTAHATFAAVNWLVDSGESLGATPFGYSHPAFTVPFAAIVEVHVQIAFDPNGTGRRLVRMLKNGTETYRGPESTPSASTATMATLHGLVRVAAGDTLHFETYQTSGGNLNIVGNTLQTYVMLRAQRIA